MEERLRVGTVISVKCEGKWKFRDALMNGEVMNG